ncbi:MAG: helix-turn-helix transcriptional regulator [Lewinellaceae bacterium]|nr:helix-turn-helix transcriptional regulator [Lewinellaceae bacterium]MCB9355450.1 helix-turn-helix transcriptional regulator [Lewinellaceae bacterium]
MKKDNKIDRIFKALADPTRREILYLLVAAAAAMNINEVSDRFPATRQGVTKHLKVLEQAGLVDIQKRGRERYCVATPRPLKAVQEWVDFYKKFWDDKLDGLAGFLDKT